MFDQQLAFDSVRHHSVATEHVACHAADLEKRRRGGLVAQVSVHRALPKPARLGPHVMATPPPPSSDGILRQCIERCLLPPQQQCEESCFDHGVLFGLVLGGALGWTSACLYVRFRGVGGPVAERPEVSVIQPEDLSSTSRFRDSWEREAAATGTLPTARGVAAMASWRR